jgi:hypothetical protein
MSDFMIILCAFFVPLTVGLWAFYFFCRTKRGDAWLDKHFE